MDQSGISLTPLHCWVEPFLEEISRFFFLYQRETSLIKDEISFIFDLELDNNIFLFFKSKPISMTRGQPDKPC